jgi:phage tail sheath gpL-like
MSTTGNPQTTIQLLAAKLAQTVKGRNDLLCGTLPVGATAVDGQLYTDVVKKTKTELDSLFLINSDLRNRIDQFIASNGGYSQLDVKAVAENGAGTAAVGTLTFGTGAGTATEDGDYTISLVDNRQFSAKVSVKTGDTDLAVATKFAAALSSLLYPTMPMAVAVDGVDAFKVNFTSVDKSETGNSYKIELLGTVEGVGTPVLVQPIGGSNNPVVATFFDNLESTRFTGINWPTAWLDSIDVIKDFLDDRFNAANTILDGVGFIGKLGDFATVKAIVDAQNSASIVIGGNTVAMFQPADWTLSNVQGVRSRRMTLNAPLGAYVTTTAGTLDLIGGVSLASLPYFNTPLNQLSVVDPNALYSNQEQGELEEAGFSTYGVNDAQNGMITGVFVTTYTTDNAGNPNESFHYLNYVDTASICREYFFANLRSRFSQSRLTNGTLVAGRSIENEQSIRMEFAKLYKELSLLVLTVAGEEAQKFFLENLTVTIDLASRSVTAIYQLPIVTQMGRIDAVSQLNFNFKEGV